MNEYQTSMQEKIKKNMSWLLSAGLSGISQVSKFAQEAMTEFDHSTRQTQFENENEELIYLRQHVDSLEEMTASKQQENIKLIQDIEKMKLEAEDKADQLKSHVQLHEAGVEERKMIEEEYDKLIEELNQRIIDLENKQENSNEADTFEILQTEIAQVKSSYAEEIAKVSHLESQLENSRKQIADSEHDILGMKATVDALKERNRELEGKCESNEVESRKMKEYSDENTRLKMEIIELKSRELVLDQTNGGDDSSLNAELARLKQVKADLNLKIEQLESSALTSSKSYAESYSKLEAELEFLKNERRANVESTTSQEELVSLQNKVRELETSMFEQKSQNHSLEARVNEISSLKEEVEAELRLLQSSISNLESKHKSEVSKYIEEINLLKLESKTRSPVSNESTSMESILKAEIDAKDVELERLRNSLSELESTLSINTETISDREKRISEYIRHENILLNKEKEWIEYNKVNEEYAIQSGELLKTWAKLLHTELEQVELANAGDLLVNLQSLNPVLMKVISGKEELAHLLKKSEDALLLSENAKHTAIESRENIIKQLKTQYENIVKQLSKIQGDAKEAYSKENAVQSEVAGLRSQIALLNKENVALHETVTKLSQHESEVSSDSELKIVRLETEVAELEAELSNSEYAMSDLRNDVARLTRECSSYEIQVQEFINEINGYRAKLLEAQDMAKEQALNSEVTLDKLRKKVIELESDLGTSKALSVDFNRVSKELEFKTIENDRHVAAVSNLHNVLEQMQSDLEHLKGTLKTERELVDTLKLEIASLNVSLSKKDSEISQNMEDLVRKIHQCESLENQMATMRAGMIQKLKLFGGDENVVDRRIVVKLLVTFFEHNKPREVLELMSKMLQFTEDEKEKVGLNKKGSTLNKFASYLPTFVSNLPKNIVSLATIVNEKQTPAPTISVDGGENLAELWVKFLMSDISQTTAQSEVRSVQNNPVLPKSNPIVEENTKVIGSTEAASILPAQINPQPVNIQPTPVVQTDTFQSFSLPPFQVISDNTTSNYPYSFPPPMFQK